MKKWARRKTKKVKKGLSSIETIEIPVSPEREMGYNYTGSDAIRLKLKRQGLSFLTGCQVLTACRFLDSSQFSDFAIRIADRTFPVHRLVICAQSEYFYRLLHSDNWRVRLMLANSRQGKLICNCPTNGRGNTRKQKKMRLNYRKMTLVPSKQ